jgi:hypothetical protein
MREEKGEGGGEGGRRRKNGVKVRGRNFAGI